MTISVGSSALLDPEQPLDHLVLLGAGLARIDLDDLVLVAPVEEGVGLDQLHAARPACVVSRAMTSTNGLTIGRPDLARVGLQLDLHALVQADAVFQLHPLQLVR